MTAIEENQTSAPPESPSEMPLPTEPRAIFLGGLLTLALLAAAYVTREIAIPLMFAMILELMLRPVMRLLERIRLHRMAAALLIIFVVLIVIIMLGAAVAGPAGAWMARLPDGVPRLEQRLSFLREPMNMALGFFQKIEGGSAGAAPRLSPIGLAATEVLGALFSGARGFVSELFTTILFLYFLLLAGDSFLRKLVEILPHFGAKRQAIDISLQIEDDIGAYLVTITVMNALVGFAAAATMHWTAVGDPLLWGIVAFLLNFAPIIGPAIGVFVFVLAGLLTIENVWYALVPAGIYFGIHLIEGEMLTPMLLARRFTVNPLLVILSLVFWFWMWGIPGAILSAPMLAILKIISDHVRPLAALGHLLEA